MLTMVICWLEKLMKFEHCKQSQIHPATRNGADKETE